MARILLAEDEISIRDLLTQSFIQEGHDVLAVPHGGAALTALHHRDPAHPPFDLLLADIKMPVMDGISLALAASRDQPELPILLMTGYAEQQEKAFNLDSLIDGIIEKPFELSVINEAVNNALRA